ncbi:MAG: L-aspartate oxidase [Prolixibacteraceae bacterium]|nr:L-aspartate oxidase [Prolixibacteraceae bacterium]
MQEKKIDILVIGSGLAGLTAAWYASQYGSVAVVTKSELDTSNSWQAQGGIAAVTGDDDYPELHINDTLTAGRGLCDLDAVETLVCEGRERVQELIDMGMSFDKENGEIILGLEGGHSRRRILHADGDATGKKLTSFMLEKVKEKANVQSFEFMTVVRLLKSDGRVCGAQALSFLTGENFIFRSKAVIMATGGLSRIFSRSTNPHTATGEAISVAYECGAQLVDMEFIQFHPTALYLENSDAFLISEAVRGEGAYLLNNMGERFMTSHPLAELAPRDVVSYCIFREMDKTGADCVFLSLSHLDENYLRSRFRNIYDKLGEFGLNMHRDKLPVAPAAHYMVGGIFSGLHGETNIPGLFVCGEVASTGVMGANRLASNSLLECLVFGKRASEKAAQLDFPDAVLPVCKPFINDLRNEQTYLILKNEMADLMMRKMGIIREKEKMEEALQRFAEIVNDFADHKNEYNLFKIKAAAEVCLLVSRAAMMREESRGGHIRIDFPGDKPEFRRHIVQQLNKKPFFVNR